MTTHRTTPPRPQDAHARRAAAILREDQPLDPKEQAAATVITDGAWILWHARDRDLAVARLLHRAGLLRDLEHERQQERQQASARRLAERVRDADRALLGALDGIVTEALSALRDGRDTTLLADQIQAAYRRAHDEHARRTTGHQEGPADA